MNNYPWYTIVSSGTVLSQGEMVENCPLVSPDSSIDEHEGDITVDAEVVFHDVIVVTQSCDLINRKVNVILVCPVYPLEYFATEVDAKFRSKSEKEKLRKGYYVGYHLLNKCEIDGYERDFSVVDLRSPFGVSRQHLDKLAAQQMERIALLSPYKEHLSQAFARFFMRVGLPIDIPSFG